ncbi:hypothetical protein ACG0Z6_06845 [Roseateles sp. BYS180W]|uniref:DUF4156 domain-containing protein n=1 Tax=Roseateles rivi TaxID=3299028 RepID=A0ABW7FUH9_9BURK
MNLTRALSLSAVVATAVLCSACISVERQSVVDQEKQLERMTEQAVKACGAGNVKEVSNKGFTCR